MAYIQQNTQTDFNQVLELIKNEDEMIVYQGVQQLSTSLSVAQDNALRNFPMDEIISALLLILERPILTDFTTEVKFHAVLSLTNLIDISPNIVSHIVNAGGVNKLCETMGNAFGFVELAEACIKALEKISHENPHVILTSQTLQITLNMIDFFEQTTKLKIICVAANVSRAINNKQDYETHILPIMPALSELLNMRGEHNKKLIEQMTTIILRLCECFLKLHHSRVEFGQVSLLFLTLQNCNIVQSLQQMFVEASLSYAQDKQADDSNRVFSVQTISQILKILTLCSKYSAQIATGLINFNAFKQIEPFLPEGQGESQEQAFLGDAIAFLDALIPEKPEQLEHEEANPEKMACEGEKRIRFEGDSALVAGLAEKLLPKIFRAFEESISGMMRWKSLLIIDKVISLLSAEMLGNFIEPYSFAKFIYGIFKSQNLKQTHICCQIVKRLTLQKTQNFTVAFMREGIFSFIELLRDKEYIISLYGKPQHPASLKGEPSFLQYQKDHQRMLEKTQQMIQEVTERKLKEVQSSSGKESEDKKKLDAIIEQKNLQILQIKQKLELTEQARLSQELSINQQPDKVPESQKMQESIVKTAREICELNEKEKEFLDSVRAQHFEELSVIERLSAIGKNLKAHTLEEQNITRSSKETLEDLRIILMSKQKVTPHEFEQSGVLEHLANFLTQTKDMLLAAEEKKNLQKLKQDQEEMKDEELIKRKETLEQSAQNVTDSAAKTMLRRLQEFNETMLISEQAHLPIHELIGLCHEEISANDTYIFKDSSILKEEEANENSQKDLFAGFTANEFFHNTQKSLDQMRALQQKRVRINLEYDQKRSLQVSGMGTGPELVSSKSTPPFAAALSGGNQEQTCSKVFMHRDYLFSELKMVTASVDHCASMWLLEDFLRTRCKTIEEIRKLKTPQAYAKRHNNNSKVISSSPLAMDILEAAKDRLREILENGESDEQAHDETNEFIEQISQDIAEADELTDEEQEALIKELEYQTLQFLDDMYGGLDSSLRDRDMSEEDLDQAEAKVIDYHRQVNRIRQLVKEKKEKRNPKKQLPETTTPPPQGQPPQGVPDDSEPMDISGDEAEEESKNEKKANDEKKAAEMIMDTAGPELKKEVLRKFSGSSDSDMSDGSSDGRKKSEDVDAREEKLRKRLARAKESRKEGMIDLGNAAEGEGDAKKSRTQKMKEDLEELIKANGKDIEFEFMINNRSFTANQTILEIIKQSKKDYYKSGGNQGFIGSPDQITIKFSIKDTNAEQTKMRKDSLMEFSQFKDSPMKIRRSMSLAVDEEETATQQFISEILLKKFVVMDDEDEDAVLDQLDQPPHPNSESMYSNLFGGNPPEFLKPKPKEAAASKPRKSSVKSLEPAAANADQQMLTEEDQAEPEAPVKVSQQSKTDGDIDLRRKKQRTSLVCALKLLKVAHLICNTQFLIGQNSQLLLGQDTGEAQGMTEEEYQFALSKVTPQQFCHSKLNQFLMKNIQDPYNLMSDVISGQIKDIFQNCSFLFPFQTRTLFFKLMTFMGAIDMYRSIYFLKQYLKSKGANIMDDKNNGKTQKQKAVINREQILSHAMNVIKSCKKQAFLEISYEGEPGTGLGPTLEFYQLIASELRGKRELWRPLSDNSLFPAPIDMKKSSNEQLAQVYDLWRLAGAMTAKSIVDDKLIDLPFNSLFWDIALGKKTSLFDLERIEPEMYKNLADFQRMANRRKEIMKKCHDPEKCQRQLEGLTTMHGGKIEDYELTFSTSFTIQGTNKELVIELKQDGANTSVTLANAQDYIDLICHSYFHENIKLQVNAFKKGFNSIFPIESLKCFSHQEIEHLVCGENDLDWTDISRLQDVVTPNHGYHAKSPEFLNFLQLMSQMDNQQKRKFLLFVTGAPRLPLGGLAQLTPKLTVVMRKGINQDQEPDSALPTVMTCVNYVKLPKYTSIDIMKMKLEQAMEDGVGNFNLS